jgi:hypothetical protein
VLLPHKVSPQEYINEEIKVSTKREKKHITRKESQDVDGDGNFVDLGHDSYRVKPGRPVDRCNKIF